MPIKNLIVGDAQPVRTPPQGAPDWVPPWMPDVKTLDYIVKFATAALVTIGVLYMLGIRPRPVRAIVAAKDVVL